MPPLSKSQTKRAKAKAEKAEAAGKRKATTLEPPDDDDDDDVGDENDEDDDDDDEDEMINLHEEPGTKVTEQCVRAPLFFWMC